MQLEQLERSKHLSYAEWHHLQLLRKIRPDHWRLEYEESKARSWEADWNYNYFKKQQRKKMAQDQPAISDGSGDGPPAKKLKPHDESMPKSDEDSEVATDVNPVTSVSKEEPVDPYSDSGSDSD